MVRTLIGLLVGVGMGTVLMGPVWAQTEGEAPLPESPVMEPEPGDGMDGEPGGETGDGTDPMDVLDDEANGPGGSERVTQKLAQQFDVEADQITSLRDEGLGYGEVGHTLRLANTLPGGITDENVSQILEMRKEQGMGWGNIAHELDIKLGHVAGKGHTSPVVTDPGTTEPGMDPGMEAPESPVMSDTTTTSGQQVGGEGSVVRGFGKHDGKGHGLGHAKGPSTSTGVMGMPGSHGGGHGAGGLGHGGGAGGFSGGGGHGGTRGKSSSAPGHNR